MLFIVVAVIWFVGSTAGALYFQSPARDIGYDKQHAIFAYTQGVVFGLLPAIGGEWIYSLLALPAAVFMSTKIIDRRQERIEQRKRAHRH